MRLALIDQKWMNFFKKIQIFIFLVQIPELSISGGLGSKGLCDIPYKKIQKAPKVSFKGVSLNFFIEDCIGPTTNVAASLRPLWPVRPFYKTQNHICVFFEKFHLEA
jgi:hypothetical protein